jgi:predicted DCC family thiol-disulfide oxidoreductase YuxK
VRGDEGAVLLYDRDCGFCVWSAQMFRAWDRRSRVAAVPIQSEEGARALGQMPPAARLASMHVVTNDGTLLSGGEALPALFRPLPGGQLVARLMEAMPQTTDRSYRLVSRHRGALGHLLGRRSRPSGTSAR